MFSTPQGTASNTATKISTPFASPLFSGIFPGSPLKHSPELALHHLEVIPPLSLDGSVHNQMFSGTIAHSPQGSPLGPRKLSIPVSYLNEKLQRSPQVGIVHLALQSDSAGLILTLVLSNLTFLVLINDIMCASLLFCARFLFFLLPMIKTCNFKTVAF